jgi:hypothetical protein
MNCQSPSRMGTPTADIGCSNHRGCMHRAAGRHTLAAVVAGLAADEVDVISQDPNGLVQDDIAVGELAGNWQAGRGFLSVRGSTQRHARGAYP